MRVAIYARYSDDKQSPHSIDDQVRVCREHAARAVLGEIVAVYSDAAVSGAALVTRPEARRLLDDARLRRFDVATVKASEMFHCCEGPSQLYDNWNDAATFNEALWLTNLWGRHSIGGVCV